MKNELEIFILSNDENLIATIFQITPNIKIIDLNYKIEKADLVIIDSDYLSMELILKYKINFPVLLISNPEFLLKVIDFFNFFLTKPLNNNMYLVMLNHIFKPKENPKEIIFQQIQNLMNLAYYKGLPNDREKISNYYISRASIFNFLNKSLYSNISPKEFTYFFDLVIKLLDKKITLVNNLHVEFLSQTALNLISFILIGWLIIIEDLDNTSINIWNNMITFKLEINDTNFHKRLNPFFQIWLEKAKPFLSMNSKIQIDLLKLIDF